MLKILKIFLSIILTLSLIFLTSCATSSTTSTTEEIIEEILIETNSDNSSDNSQSSKPSSSKEDGGKSDMNEAQKPTVSTPSNKKPSANQGGSANNVADQNIGSDIQISDTIKKEEQTVFTPITLDEAKKNAEKHINSMAASLNVSNMAAVNSAISNSSNYRLAKLFEKALKGQNLTIATLGGSITSGALASSKEEKYANRIQAWFEATFPNIKVTLINAGIGSTSSAFGIYRLKEDVLIFEPDLIVIEYSVNDYGNGNYLTETYEGLLRSALSYEDAAVVPLYFAMKGKGTAQDDEKPIADYYKLPQASFYDAFKGYSDWNNMFGDDLHPNSQGHGRAALVFNQLMTTALGNYNSAEKSYTMPAAKYSSSANYGNDTLVKLQYESGAISFLQNKIVNNKATDSPLTNKIAFKNNNFTLKQNDYALVHHNFDIISIAQGKTLKFTIKDIKTFLIIMNRDADCGKKTKIVVTENDTGKKKTTYINSYFSWSHLWDSGPLYASSNGNPHSVTVEITPLYGKFCFAGLGISE